MQPYQMPDVSVGDTVYHYDQWNSLGFRAAIVTAVYERTVAVHIFNENTYNSEPLSAVRHKGDPDHKVLNEQGYWDHRPETLRLKALLAEMEPARV